MLPCKHAQTLILAFQCRKTAVDIKGRGINKIYCKNKWGNIPLLLLLPPTQFPNGPFSPLDSNIQTKQKTNEKQLKEDLFLDGLIKHNEIKHLLSTDTQERLQV